MSKYQKLPLADIAMRYLDGETMPVLAAEFNAQASGLYRRLVRDRLIPAHPKTAAGVPPDEFVEIWNSSASVDEVARRANIKRGTAIMRAVSYRKRGIMMKKYPRGLVDYEDRAAAAQRWQQERTDRRPLPEMERHDPDGRHRKECPNCGRGFSTNKSNVRYCSDVCTQRGRSKRKSNHTRQGLSIRTCRNSACPNGFTFNTNNPRAEYCSSDCKKAAQNRRYYVAHREDVISRVLVARKKD